VASFAVLIALTGGFIASLRLQPGHSTWIVLLVWMAGGSIVLGNLGALVQTSVRGLLAYSAIAHAGYMLLGIAAHTEQSARPCSTTRLPTRLTTVGAFGVIAIVERAHGSDRLDSFAGLSRRNPLLAAAC
jgi:NADH-quinone oxidoreductase subunit N